MSFKQAKKKLKKIAGIKYHSIGYELTISNYKPFEEARCTLYIDGFDHNSGNTWEEAFKKLKLEMNPKPKEAPNMKQAP